MVAACRAGAHIAAGRVAYRKVRMTSNRSIWFTISVWPVVFAQIAKCLRQIASNAISPIAECMVYTVHVDDDGGFDVLLLSAQPPRHEGLPLPL